MFKTLFTTQDRWAGLIIRLTVGMILFPHGLQKSFGWFGGYGFTGTMTFFTDTMHLPWLIGFLVIVIENLGAVSLIIGVGTRIWSTLTAILMIGIVVTSHFQHGFFMNWFGNQQGEGYEYHLLALGICIALIIEGGGKSSVDQWVSRQWPTS